MKKILLRCNSTGPLLPVVSSLVCWFGFYSSFAEFADSCFFNNWASPFRISKPLSFRKFSSRNELPSTSLLQHLDFLMQCLLTWQAPQITFNECSFLTSFSIWINYRTPFEFLLVCHLRTIICLCLVVLVILIFVTIEKINYVHVLHIVFSLVIRQITKVFGILIPQATKSFSHHAQIGEDLFPYRHLIWNDYDQSSVSPLRFPNGFNFSFPTKVPPPSQPQPPQTIP